MVSSLYESSYAGLDYSSMKMLSNTGCTDMVSPQYESSYVYQEYSFVKMLSYTGNMYMVFSPEWAFICWSRSPLANSIGDIEKVLETLE